MSRFLVIGGSGDSSPVDGNSSEAVGLCLPAYVVCVVRVLAYLASVRSKVQLVK